MINSVYIFLHKISLLKSPKIQCNAFWRSLVRKRLWLIFVLACFCKWHTRKSLILLIASSSRICITITFQSRWKRRTFCVDSGLVNSLRHGMIYNFQITTCLHLPWRQFNSSQNWFRDAKCWIHQPMYKHLPCCWMFCVT